jgi:uncharacterized protein involved in type VI secretion and phage assembly
VSGPVTRPRQHVQPVNDPFDHRWYGVHTALVKDNQDPLNLGRVKVQLPWIAQGTYEVWARVATLMAGDNRGSWFIPEKEDEVLVAFLNGDPDHPYVLGGLWNGQDRPPESMDADNNVKAIVSRNGIKVELDDSRGRETVTISTPGGNRLVMADGPSDVKVSDANGNSIELATSGITITAARTLTINASEIDVSAALATFDVPMTIYSGVVQTETNITNATISTSYTPGAGNVW